MSENEGSEMVVAFGVGLLVGAAVALLLAPASGEETRRKVGDLAKAFADRVRDGGDDAARGEG